MKEVTDGNDWYWPICTLASRRKAAEPAEPEVSRYAQRMNRLIKRAKGHRARAIAVAAIVPLAIAACNPGSSVTPPPQQQAATTTPSPAPSPTPSATAAQARPPAPSAPAPEPTQQTTPPAPPPPPPPPTTQACYPLSDEGTCYEPGEYCRDDDHGATGMAGDGETITCEDNDGWRWEPAGSS